MIVRPAVRAAFGATLAAAPLLAGAQRPEYAAGTTHYAITTTATGYAEQMGQRQDVAFDTQQRVTITISRRTRDTLAVTLTLDSLAGRMPNGMPIDGASARGLTVRGTLSPAGRVYTRQVVADSGKEALGQSAQEMIRFLPVLPERLAVGVTWADTTDSPVTQMGMQISRKVVTVYHVAGDTTYDGEKSWRIDRNAVATISGSGSAMGQPLTLDGQSTGTGSYYLSKTGTLLGAALTDAVKSKVVAGGAEITSDQTQKTTIARAK